MSLGLKIQKIVGANIKIKKLLPNESSFDI
jgi:hypothetical protein